MKRLLIIFLVLSLPIGSFAAGPYQPELTEISVTEEETKKSTKDESKNQPKEKKQIIKKVAIKVKDGVSNTVDKVKDGVSNTVEKVKGGINNAKDRLSASGRATAKIERKADNATKNIDKFCKKNSNNNSCKSNAPKSTKDSIDKLKKESLDGINDDNANEKLKDFETKLSKILTDAGFKAVDKETNEQEKDAENEDDIDDTAEDDATPEKKLTKEQQEQKVAELRENYEDMKEIENSFENRTLGATGMATMGMGGMQLATSLAEDKADDAAEQQMKAYLATFSCTYANGKRFKGGESAIELPGGNELINLYSEYVGLANDLKERKSALGMRAGIESEPILDSATSGLYDDVSVGKTSGAFTSLARALSDPNSEDAAAWVAQRAETAEKKKNALITIGAGAVATIAGNLLINSNNPEERSAEILKKYEKLKTELNKTEQQISKQPTNTKQKKCTDFNLSGTYPECECTMDTQKFNQDDGQCNELQTPEPETETETETEKESLELTTFDVDDLFETGKSVLTENAKNTLQQTNIRDFIDETNTYCIEINGYSDNVGWRRCSKEKDINTCNNNNNKELSEMRAKAVADALDITESNHKCKQIKIQGKGCTQERCTRTVEIAACDADFDNTCTTN